ncbi:HAD family hydrolase [Catenovulum sp. SX2]|uniref:HAD family hydrolase n=1 Tax=Catenovulum sp. SX2 TaxID=3398614 RepID=UPI003F860FF6
MTFATRIAAFFDVDDTLINIKTMFSFLAFAKEHDPHFQTEQFVQFEHELASMFSKQISRVEINRFYYQSFAGLSVTRVEQLAQDWFRSVEGTRNIFNSRVVEQLKQHQVLGHQVAFVSGSCAPLLQPIAGKLGVSVLLAAPLQIVDGFYTGQLLAEPMIGVGKANAVERYAAEHQLDLQHCYAYGDHVSDLPMLTTVGQARLINPSEHMRQQFTATHTLKPNQIINLESN